MKTFIRNTVLTVIAIFAVVLITTQVSHCQDQVKVHFGYNNYRADNPSTFLPVAIDERQAFTGSVDFKLFNTKHTRLGAVGEYSTNFNQGGSLNGFKQILGGGQFSYSPTKFVELFGRVQFGVHQISGSNLQLKSYGFGGDINFSHFFVRPIAVDRQFIETFPVAITRISSGAGVRF